MHGPSFVQWGGACQPARPAALAPPPTPTLGFVAETGLAERLLESEVEVLRDRGSEQATEEGSKRLAAGMPSIKSNCLACTKSCAVVLLTCLMLGRCRPFFEARPTAPPRPSPNNPAAVGPSAAPSSVPETDESGAGGSRRRRLRLTSAARCSKGASARRHSPPPTRPGTASGRPRSSLGQKTKFSSTF